jgi:polyhydroxybutyrate depolymerase
MLALAACGGGNGTGTDAPRTIDGPPVDVDAFDISARPYPLFVPTGYVEGTPTPLVVLLHGYGADGATQESYFQLQPIAEAETFLYATPNGTLDGALNQYWNATDACCDVGHLNVDDVTYLRALIHDVIARYTVDTKRIYFVGHSNGGFMSHRMACEFGETVAAIVSLAGMVWADPTKCTPAAPVAVAHIHGTADTVVDYNGGEVFGLEPYPGAQATFDTWSAIDGCTGDSPGTPLDLESSLTGAETTITRATGCTAGGAVELWTIEGGSHIPNLQPIWAQTLWDFLAAHPKP